MRGRDCFTSQEARDIRNLLEQVRAAERSRQKRLRDQIRAIGFYISDWPPVSGGFTASDFDERVRQGAVRSCDEQAE